MRNILNILIIGITILSSCDNPKANGEKLGNKLCDCMTASSDLSKEQCKSEVEKLSSEYKEKYKTKPLDMMQFVGGYTMVSSKCLGEIAAQSMSQFNGILENSGIENIQTDDYNKAIESLNQLKTPVSTSSFSLRGITFKYLFFCILLIICGVLMNMYGERKFGLSLALSFMIIWMCLFSMINFIGTTTAILIIIFSVMIYIFYKPFMYFFTWFYLAVFIALILYLPITLFASDKTIPTFLSYIALAGSAVIVYFKRSHLKKLNITFIGGISLGLGVSGIISYQQFSSGNYWDALTLPFSIIALSVLGSLVFQYKEKIFKKKNEETVVSNLNDEIKTENLVDKKLVIKLTPKQFQLIGITTIILILVSIGAYFFINYTQTTNSNVNNSLVNNIIQDTVSKTPIQEIISNEIQTDSALIQNEDENQNESYINRDPNEGDEHTQTDIYNAALDILTPYKAKFGNSEIQITIDKISESGKIISAYNIFKGKKTEMTGTYSGTFTRGEICYFTFTLEEPQGNSNGVFELHLGGGNTNGTWKSYNGKLTREFELENIDN